MKAAIVAVLLCTFLASSASANVRWTSNVKGPRGELPAIPGATGYGVYTRPAQNAKVYRVTHLRDSGHGSLEDCVNGWGNRVCVFEVSGRIKYRGNLDINNPKIHIAGQTAPYPGIVIQAPRSVIRTSDVVIEHVKFMSTDELSNRDLRNTKGYDNRDALAIESNRQIRNIVLNHVSINFGIDGNLDIWGKVDNVTIRNSIIGMMLKHSIHIDNPRTGWRSLQPHAYNMLIGHQVGDVDITRSVLAYADDRLPRSGAANLFYSENVNYHSMQNWFVDLYTRRGWGNNRNVNANVVGNRFISNGNSHRQTITRMESQSGRINLYSAKNDLLLNRGRIVKTPNPHQSAMRRNWGGATNIAWRPLPKPHRAVIPNSPVREHEVLRKAGSRPAARGALEREITRNVAARKGQLVNCYQENGDRRFNDVLRRYARYPNRDAPKVWDRCELDRKGWYDWRRWMLPTHVMNKRSLNHRLPRNSDLNRRLPSGYTQLEAFLHACSRKVENNYGDCHFRSIDRNGRGWK